MTQPDLFTRQPHFDGATFSAPRDGERLANQLQRILSLMRDEQWRTVQQISAITGDPEPSVSAQLRNLRKQKFGGYTVERRYRDGVFQFRVLGDK